MFKFRKSKSKLHEIKTIQKIHSINLDYDKDGIPNEYDPHWDRPDPRVPPNRDTDNDGQPDNSDIDIDGDGKVNWLDPTPYGEKQGDPETPCKDPKKKQNE